MEDCFKELELLVWNKQAGNQDSSKNKLNVLLSARWAF